MWCKQAQHDQNLSPLILLASWRSRVMMVTLLAWMAQRLVSSKRETRQASAASWRASTAELWNLSSCLNSWAISRTSLWKGSFLMRRSVLFWYFLISLRATVPGLKRWGFLTPVVTGALLRAIFWATSCFLGTFCAVDFLAVCFVLAIQIVIQSLAPSHISALHNVILQSLNLIGSLYANQNLTPPPSTIQNPSPAFPPFLPLSAFPSFCQLTSERCQREGYLGGCRRGGGEVFGGYGMMHMFLNIGQDQQGQRLAVGRHYYFLLIRYKQLIEGETGPRDGGLGVHGYLLAVGEEEVREGVLGITMAECGLRGGDLRGGEWGVSE